MSTAYFCEAVCEKLNVLYHLSYREYPLPLISASPKLPSIVGSGWCIAYNMSILNCVGYASYSP